MYWVLHIVGRYVRGRKNSTCVQLHIPYTCIPFLKDCLFAYHQQVLALLYWERYRTQESHIISTSY